MSGQSRLASAAYEAKLDQVKGFIKRRDAVDGAECEKWRAEGEVAKGCRDGAPYYTPLGEAVRNTGADEAVQLAIVDALLAAGAPVDELNYRNETAFHFAAQRGSATLVRRLHAAGADVKKVGCLGNAIAACITSHTPDAPGSGKVATVRALLEVGVDPRMPDAFEKNLVSECKGFVGNLTHKERRTRLRGAAVLELLEVVAADPRQQDWRELQKLVTQMRAARLEGDAKLRKLVAKLDDVKGAVGAKTFATQVKKAIGKKVAGRADELRTVTSSLLMAPEVVAHALWPDFIRALLALTVSYPDFTKSSHGKAVAVDDIEDDDSGAFDAYGDDELCTVEHCLRACAAPGASTRADFDELVRAIADHKRACVGTMSFGDSEAAALARVLQERKHPTYTALLGVLRTAWPYASLPR